MSKDSKKKYDSVENTINLRSICMELESCRNLKKQFIDVARQQSPFSEEYPSKEKLDNYIGHLKHLQGLYAIEKSLLEMIPLPPIVKTT